MPDDILATIVVTPRERFSTALRCLPEVIENTKTPHQLVYVAGGAPGYIRTFLTQTCQRQSYDLILEPEFLPPNSARNIGLRRVKTKYAVFLDNDVLVEPGWLDELVRCAEETGADVVGPLCLFGEPDLGIVHSAGGDLKSHEAGGQRWMTEKHRYPNICLKTRPVELRRAPCDYVEFHCMLARRDLFDRIGLLDEEILSACEHMDVALRVRACGGKIYTEPAAVVSYLTDAEYLVSDAEFFRLRWCDDWNARSLAHLATRWQHDRHSSFFTDQESFLRRQQEICPLPRPVPRLARDVRAERHPFAQTLMQLADQMESVGYPPWDLESVRQAHAAAVILFLGVYRQSGEPFIAHLVSTASVLAAYGAPVSAIVAALLHAAYPLGRFQGHVEGDLGAQRRWLKGRIGSRVEALIFEYCRLDYPDVQTAVLESDLDRLRMNLAHAVSIRIANSIDAHLDLDLLNTRNPQETLAKNTAQNERWREVYRKIAIRLGYAPMLDLLYALHEEVKNKPISRAAPSGHEGHYWIDPKTGTAERIEPRAVAGTASSATNGGTHAARMPSAATELLLERLRGTRLGKVIEQIDLKKIRPDNQGVLRLGKPKFPRNLFVRPTLVIETDPRPWSFSAHVDVRPSKDASGSAVLRVTLRVDQGELGVGLLRPESTTEYAVPEQSQDPSANPIDLLFPIPDLREIGNLIFRNWDTSGTVTVARVFCVSLHSPNGAPV
jgi:hypothetical protein